jgi:hypothetical protein
MSRLVGVIRQTCAWPNDKLSAGPVPVKEVDQHARALGIVPRTSGRARKAPEGAHEIKDGFGSGWGVNSVKPLNGTRKRENKTMPARA